jgi:predicted HTH transcriptional regulator
MNADIIPVVISNAFRVPGHATQIEALIGAEMLKAERKAGHVGKIPTFTKAGLGSDKPDADHWLKKAKELVKVLKGQPPMGREQLAIIMKCSKETMARRASFAVKQGMIVKLDSKSWKAGVPTITYAIGNEAET